MPASMTMHFFLGAHTPRGYLMRFDQLDRGTHDRKLILKGGPGCGKATLIRRVVERVEADAVELIHCPADPASLDGAILSRGDRRVVIFDGTPPHALEPRYPGVVETLLDLGEGLDERVLAGEAGAILALADRERELTGRIHRFLAAAGALLGDTAQLALRAVDAGKLERFAERLCRRELATGAGAAERVRFLTALTAEGVVLAGDTPGRLCERIYPIDDPYGAVSRLLLEGIRQRALARDYAVISCFCPMAPFAGLEHLFIPEAGVGFVTRRRMHPDLPSELRPINGRRFLDMETLGLRRQRVGFNRRAVQELLGEASRLFGEMATAHAALEARYRRAMDNSDADRLTDRACALAERTLAG